jgi:hypothetical protein
MVSQRSGGYWKLLNELKEPSPPIHMIPTEPKRRTSMGRNPMEPLMDLRNLLKEEIAMHNYLEK